MRNRLLEDVPALERLAADAALLEACLAVHGCFDLRDQAATLADRSLGWLDGRFAVLFGPSEESRNWTMTGTTLPKKDPLLAIVGKIDVERLRSSVAAGVRIHDGLGPMADRASSWPDPLPAATTVVGLADSGDGKPAAAVAVFGATRPSAAALERVERLVEAVRPAVRNAEQVAAMRDLVIKDDTAHCFNRRYFETSLPDELSRASRFHAPLSLIFLDMDNLKEVNNRFGHAMGSRTLCEVSRRIRQKIRRFDKLFRFGGDEFCIVLPETEWHGALEVAERVREAIAGQPFLVTELTDAGGAKMTASLGIASYPLHARNQAELIELADRAMQRIKGGTKNAIGIAEAAEDDDER